MEISSLVKGDLLNANILLKIFVDLVAVISAVGNHDLAVTRGSHALRAVKWAGERVDERKERTLRIKYLDPGVAPVRNDDVVLKSWEWQNKFNRKSENCIYYNTRWR